MALSGLNTSKTARAAGRWRTRPFRSNGALAWNRVKLLITLPSTAKSGERWCHWSNFGVHVFTVPYGQGVPEKSGLDRGRVARFIEKRICVSMITY